MRVGVLFKLKITQYNPLENRHIGKQRRTTTVIMFLSIGFVLDLQYIYSNVKDNNTKWLCRTPNCCTFVRRVRQHQDLMNSSGSIVYM